MRAVALVVALVPLSVLAARSPGFRVAPITAIIVLLGGAGASLGPFAFAVDRVLEVGLGCAVGLVASVIVAPTRATRSAFDAAARVSQLLAQQLSALAAAGAQQSADAGALGAATRKALTALETLLGEAENERRSRLVHGPDPAPLLRTLIRLRHDVAMLRRAAVGVWDEAVRDQLAEPWAQAARVAAQDLSELGEVRAGRRAPGRAEAVADAFAGYRKALEGVRRQGLTRGLGVDEAGRLFGIGFALDQLRRDLDDLEARTRELVTEQRIN